jgi:hypothetical protein
VAQVVKHLLSKYKALSSNSNTTTKKTTTTKKKRGEVLYYSGFCRGAELIEYTHTHLQNYKRGFFGLAYIIGGWVVQQYLSACYKARKPCRNWNPQYERDK